LQQCLNDLRIVAVLVVLLCDVKIVIFDIEGWQWYFQSIYLLQYVRQAIYCIAISSAINIFIAIPATTNILYCNISSQQYINCNICDHQYIVLQYYIQSTMLFCSIYRQVTKNTLNCNIRCINVADKSDIRSCNLQNTKSSNNNT
jgi:hypothetical protein